MKHSLVAVLMALVVGGACAGYQPEPYVEVQHRDEHFTPEGGASQYGGETYLVGVRYVPPVRMEEFQLTRVEAAMRGNPPPVNVSVPEKKSEIQALGELGKDSTGNWTGWGAAVVIAVILFGREWMGRGRGASQS